MTLEMNPVDRKALTVALFLSILTSHGYTGGVSVCDSHCEAFQLYKQWSPLHRKSTYFSNQD